MLIIKPLTPETWSDFEQLFGPKGAYSGCWCMWWRLKRKDFEAGQGEGNRRALKALVEDGQIPGILAYSDGKPIAWCSVAPRADFSSLNRSPVLKPIDDLPVWSLVCFFVGRAHRSQGLLIDLIEGVVQYVDEQGGQIIEAYPSCPKSGQMPPVNSFMGIPKVLEQAGFVEVARPSSAKAIYRYYLN
ncbi:GNAT family N-acetyltransferase [Candidatus Neomarinimicrobiota bacterium]